MHVNRKTPASDRRQALDASDLYYFSSKKLKDSDGFFVLAKLNEGSRSSAALTGRKHCQGGKDARRFHVSGEKQYYIFPAMTRAKNPSLWKMGARVLCASNSLKESRGMMVLRMGITRNRT